MRETVLRVSLETYRKMFGFWLGRMLGGELKLRLTLLGCFLSKTFLFARDSAARIRFSSSQILIYSSPTSFINLLLSLSFVIIHFLFFFWRLEESYFTTSFNVYWISTLNSTCFFIWFKVESTARFSLDFLIFWLTEAVNSLFIEFSFLSKNVFIRSNWST